MSDDDGAGEVHEPNAEEALSRPDDDVSGGPTRGSSENHEERRRRGSLTEAVQQGEGPSPIEEGQPHRKREGLRTSEAAAK